jgi:hypothetical protein
MSGQYLIVYLVWGFLRSLYGAAAIGIIAGLLFGWWATK